MARGRQDRGAQTSDLRSFAAALMLFRAGLRVGDSTDDQDYWFMLFIASSIAIAGVGLRQPVAVFPAMFGIGLIWGRQFYQTDPTPFPIP